MGDLSKFSDADLLNIVTSNAEDELKKRGYKYGWYKDQQYAGVIYILINPAFPNLVKIGYTKKLEQRWTVEPNKKITKAYSMGCYFDSNDNKWKVYSNEERGQFIVYLETDDEDSAYEELQSMVQFEIKNNKGYY